MFVLSVFLTVKQVNWIISNIGRLKWSSQEQLLNTLSFWEVSRKKRLEILRGKVMALSLYMDRKKYCVWIVVCSYATHMICFVLLAFVYLFVRSIHFLAGGGVSLKSCLQELEKEENTKKSLWKNFQMFNNSITLVPRKKACLRSRWKTIRPSPYKILYIYYPEEPSFERKE